MRKFLVCVAVLYRDYGDGTHLSSSENCTLKWMNFTARKLYLKNPEKNLKLHFLLFCNYIFNMK